VQLTLRDGNREPTDLHYDASPHSCAVSDMLCMSLTVMAYCSHRRCAMCAIPGQMRLNAHCFTQTLRDTGKLLTLSSMSNTSEADTFFTGSRACMLQGGASASCLRPCATLVSAPLRAAVVALFRGGLHHLYSHTLHCYA
jgi:hypothetical protein